VLAVVGLLTGLVRSPAGLAMRSVRDHVAAAQVLGVDAPRLRRQLFVLSAVLGSVAGSLFAHFSSYVSLASFGVGESLNFLLIAILGGVRKVWGAVLGAVVVTLLPHWTQGFGDLNQVILGGVMVAVIVLAPEGLASLSPARLLAARNARKTAKEVAA
jgi:branched-chain amino acid transport system permease protein